MSKKTPDQILQSKNADEIHDWLETASLLELRRCLRKVIRESSVGQHVRDALDILIATGNQNDSLIALKDGKPINMVVPYPMGFWAKGLDGRIDDPSAGWKGRGVWSNTGNRTPFHMEGGKGTTPKVVKFQMRPDPLEIAEILSLVHRRSVVDRNGDAALLGVRGETGG